MSKTKFCPECGISMNIDERFCPECGAKTDDIVAENQNSPTPSKGTKETDAAVVGVGSRSNVVGGINTNTNTTTTNLNNTTTNANIQTSNIDNSSVVNNTTIVMDRKKTSEFCEVCGSPFDGKHARCPKCGKMICFDCKVKGKNRCVECEKKAANEYRIAFQQLLLTTNGNIGAAGRQMMNQKARDLDVENVKAGIEKELMEEFKPTLRSEQPAITTNTTRATTTTEPTNYAKGGVVDNRAPLRPKSNESHNSSKWIFLVIFVVVAVGVFFLLGKGDSSEPQQTSVPIETEQSTPSKTPVQSNPIAVESKPAVTVDAPKAQPAKPVQPAKVAEPKRDVNYEAGMEAYNKGEGLEAISKFKASGSAKANYMLGVIYENGCGNVAANAMMARKYFKTAAGQGSEEAKAKL